MADRIIVSSNCQTGGLAATLKALFPNFIVKPVALPNVNDQIKINELTHELKSAKIWITSGCYSLADGFNLKLVKVPQVGFYAFHPDLCYAKNKRDGSTISPHYNSKIAIWAFNKNLDVETAAKLFNSNVYKALGYYDGWYQNEAHLKRLFLSHEYTEQDFNRFFLYLKRHGSFMYSINHPRPKVLIELGKLVASKILDDKSFLDREVIIPDGLTDPIWPLYPEVGEQLGLVGDYAWRIAGCDVVGVLAFIKYNFDNYSSLGLIPGDVEITGDRFCPVFDVNQEAFLLKEINL